MSPKPDRRGIASVVLAIVAVTLTGCGLDARNLPLPGTGVGGDTKTFDGRFDNAVNLTIGARVTVNGADAGRVTDISTDGYNAIAELTVEQSAPMTEDSTARLRYDTPLGELFVDVTTPDGGRPLTDGATLSQERTSTAPSVEDSLASASLLINGGGIGDLGRIVDELNVAVGDGSDLRAVIADSATFLRRANQTTRTIDRALRSLESASISLNAEKGTINGALQAIGPAARTIRENTTAITRLLRKIVRLSRTANSVVDRGGDSMLQIIRQAGPILREVDRISADLGPGLTAFSDAVDALLRIIPGDYLPLLLRADLKGTLGGELGIDPLLPPGYHAPPASPGQNAVPDLLRRLDDLLGLPSLGRRHQPPTARPSSSVVRSLSHLLTAGRP